MLEEKILELRASFENQLKLSISESQSGQFAELSEVDNATFHELKKIRALYRPFNKALLNPKLSMIQAEEEVELPPLEEWNPEINSWTTPDQVSGVEPAGVEPEFSEIPVIPAGLNPNAEVFIPATSQETTDQGYLLNPDSEDYKVSVKEYQEIQRLSLIHI